LLSSEKRGLSGRAFFASPRIARAAKWFGSKRLFLCAGGMNPSALIKSKIRTVRNWPKVGVNFRDVTTLFHDPVAFRAAIDAFAEDCERQKVDTLAAIDARGFILGGALAYRMNKPFALVRKKGKLPYKTLSEDYTLEYGTATVEIHADACKPGERILIVDDLIATGGTLLAAAKLFRLLHGEVVGVAAIIDLPELGGSARLKAAGLAVHALCEFSENE
jgi:adenine phosphoribosyltransferase